MVSNQANVLLTSCYSHAISALLSCVVFFYQHILLLSLALFDYANHTILKFLLCIESYQMLRKSHLFFSGVWNSNHSHNSKQSSPQMLIGLAPCNVCLLCVI